MKWVKEISRKIFRKYVANKFQNAGNKKTKHAKFFKKKNVLFSCYLRFEIRSFALLPINTFDGSLDSRALIERLNPTY